MIKKDRLSVEHHFTRLSLKQQGQLRMKMDAINKQRQTGKFIYDISGNAR